MFEKKSEHYQLHLCITHFYIEHGLIDLNYYTCMYNNHDVLCGKSIVSREEFQIKTLSRLLIIY